MNVNKAIVVGNLTRDPETRTIPSGQNVTSFSVATNRFWTDKETGEKKKQAEYHNIIAWGRLGEIVQNFMKKGGLIYVEGRLQTRNWQDQQGAKRSRTEIIAEKLQLGPRPEAKENVSSFGESSSEEDVTTDEINVEEIPF
ncbi:MAG: single-stranded DNA-binding protein [Patescibacteria group bacterium]|jgi:single-strand DNA-binding protein|nr:single-stranded DNA-binding protein [Patescibacteria group bacterium]MDD5172775.1 single-stranded DNA-binding protein [Patescibacteria group bacterium]